MSSLIFFTDKHQVLVATDTLGVSSGGEPFLFTSKAIHIPHLKTIIAGTGIGGFSHEWAMHVNNKMAVRGIHNLDYHTPKMLLELWSQYSEKTSITDSFTTTVYQFGISEETQEIVSFAYRSTNEFVSEELGYGTFVKPECQIPNPNSLIDSIPSMMEEQREIQSRLPKNKRVYIGGEIYVLHLAINGCTSYKLFEFPDFRDEEVKIFT